LIRGEVAAEELKEVSMEKYQAAIELLESNLKSSPNSGYNFIGAGLKTAQDILQRRLIYETAIKKRQLIPCQAGRLTAVVTETGDVYPCESFTAKLGNVRESNYDLQAILQNERSIHERASIKRKECFCTHECYTMMNILFNPGQYPELLKEYLKLQL
jgi:radical SAM protein with 4Fe4S-binding SPASM domain